MNRITHFKYYPGDPSSIYPKRRMDIITLGNGNRYFFRNKETRDRMLVDFENHVNDVFGGLFLVESELMELFYDYFMILPFHFIDRFEVDLNYLRKQRNRCIFQSAKGYTNNCEIIYKSLTAYSDELKSEIRKSEKELTNLRKFEALKKTGALIQNCELLIEKLNAYEFENAYLVERIDD